MELQKKYKNIKAYKNVVQKEATYKNCVLGLDLKPFRS